MQYLLLFYESSEDFAARFDSIRADYWQGWAAYSATLGQSGNLFSGAALEGPETGATLRSGTVHDGPYADTKEQLGGFFIIEAESMEAAMEIAARAPTAGTGAVEVRPVLPMTQNQGKSDAIRFFAP